jgi:hypothetical protein
VADQPKKKPVSAKSPNDNRPNRKAWKQKKDDLRTRNREFRGNHTTKSPQSEVQKVLLGGGVLRGIDRPIEGSIKGRWKMRWVSSDGA